MDDLKIPVFLLIIIMCGVGFYFYNRAQNPIQPKIKLKKNIEKTLNDNSDKQSKELDVSNKNELIVKATQEFENGSYDKTIELLSSCKENDNYKIQRLLGYSYAHIKEYDKAILAFEKSLKIRKIPLEGYSLAYLYEITGRFHAAASLYLELAELPLPSNLRKNVFEGIARISVYLPENKNFYKYSEMLLKDWPESKDGILNLIKAKRQNNSFENLEFLEEIVNKNFYENYSCNYELAQLFESAEKYNQALNIYKKCLKIDKENYTPFLDCYNVLIKLNKPDGAVKSLEYFLDSGKKYPNIYYEASLVANKAKRFKQAFRLYLTAVTLDPRLQGKNDEGLVSNVEKIYRDKGTETEKVFVNAFVCFLNGDYEYAASEINRVKDELDNSVYKNDYKLVIGACDILAGIDKKRDDEIKAYEDYMRKQKEAANSKQKNANKVSLDLITEFKKLSDTDLKTRALKSVSNYDVQIQAAMEFQSRGKIADSKLFFRNALNVNPKSHVPYYELSKINFMENDIKNSKKNIEAAIDRNPTDIDLLTFGSSVYLKGNDTSRAKDLANKALKYSPDSSSVKIVLARIYIEEQEYRKANEIIDNALEKEKVSLLRNELLKLKEQIKEK